MNSLLRKKSHSKAVFRISLNHVSLNCKIVKCEITFTLDSREFWSQPSRVKYHFPFEFAHYSNIPFFIAYLRAFNILIFLAFSIFRLVRPHSLFLFLEQWFLSPNSEPKYSPQCVHFLEIARMNVNLNSKIKMQLKLNVNNRYVCILQHKYLYLKTRHNW